LREKNMNPSKKNITMLLLAMLLIFSLANTAKGSSPASPGPPPLTEQEKIYQTTTLGLLTGIFGLNMSGYETADVITLPAPSEAYVTDKTYVTFKFRSAESDLDVGTIFTNGGLIWCMLYPVKGSPAFITPASSDILSTAKDTLDSLQAFSAKEYLPTMRSMLESVTVLQNSKTSNAEFTQEITVEGNDVRISWVPFANGLSNQQNRLTLEFKDDHLMFFADRLGIYKIGSSETKISEQEAIQIAIENARAYSWEVGNETISNANVLDDPVIASLSLQNRGNFTLYPLWDIRLPLDKMYPGGVTAFHVLIWADTGEVSSITPIGNFGNPDSVPSGSTAETQPPTEATIDYTLVVITAVMVVAIIIASILFYKRKR
jgi:hypothetical protein